VALRLLRHHERAADPRPRRPALEGRRVDLGERRHRVCAVQSPVLFIKLAAPRIPQRWTPYLGDIGTATAAA